MQKSVKQDREKYIGGSDIPIIMGISPFKTRYELLLEKAGLQEDTFEGNEYTEYGNIMEPKIREYINKTFDKQFAEGKHINGDIRCHTDGEDDDCILEIKTTSQIYEKVDDYKIYLVQLLFYMQETKKCFGYLAVYERPDDFDEKFNKERLHVYRIDIEDYKILLEQINEAVNQFRIDLQKLKENPLLTEEDLMPNDIVSISNKILLLEERLKEYKKIEEEQNDLKSKLKELMENNNIDSWTILNDTKITLVADGKDKEVLKFNEQKFKEENDDLYKKYLETKIQKGKKGYVRITIPKGE